MKGFPLRREAGRGIFLGLLVLAVCLRLANAAWGSLKVDDFHSLYHARAAELHTFFVGLLQDNHPPLSFLLVRAARWLCGEDEWALRMPALLAGLCTLWFVWRMGARLGCTAGRGAAALLLVVSTLHVEISSDVRMYALLALASAGLLDGLLACFADGRGRRRIALWTVVGLHTHYHFLYTLAALGATSLFLALREPRNRAALRPCVGAFALAGLLSAPWYVLGFPAQLVHGLAPGGSNATILRLFEGLKSLVFLNVSVAGEGLRWSGLMASAVMLLLAVTGAVGLRRRAQDAGALAWLCGAGALGAPLLAWTAAQLTPRAGYEWRYLAAALPALCLLVGAEACASGRFARSRQVGVLAVLLGALAVVVPNLRDPGTEDYRGAVEWIVTHSSGADTVVAADWQPLIFPPSLGWEYYAPRLAGGRPLPRRIEFTAELRLADPGELAGSERVICLMRSMPDGCGILKTLRQLFPREEKTAFGHSIYVHVFTRS